MAAPADRVVAEVAEVVDQAADMVVAADQAAAEVAAGGAAVDMVVVAAADGAVGVAPEVVEAAGVAAG